MTHTIQKPQFAYNALEPYFDAETMAIHTEKHHQGYADKLNAALTDQPNLQSKSLDELLLLNPTSYPLITNMAGGVWNHNFFWSILSPKFDQPVPEIFQPLIPQFTETATKLFGSGWVWITKNNSNSTLDTSHLTLLTTANQDSPISMGQVPLLGIDLWEHAYYLKYQNRRPEYIDAFWHVVNWEFVSQQLLNIAL